MVSFYLFRQYLLVLSCALSLGACAVIHDRKDIRPPFLDSYKELSKIEKMVVSDMAASELEKTVGVPIEKCRAQEVANMECIEGLEAIRRFFGKDAFGNLFSDSGNGSEMARKIASIVKEAKSYLWMRIPFVRVETKTKILFLLLYTKKEKTEKGVDAALEILLRDGKVIYAKRQGGLIDQLEKQKTFGLDPSPFLLKGINKML